MAGMGGWVSRVAGGAAAAVLVPLAAVGSPAPRSPGVPGRAVLFGVTVNDIAHLGAVTSALAGLPARPVTRIYFDVHQPPGYYARAVGRISRVSAVMGELL